jgi:hypothetical protein
VSAETGDSTLCWIARSVLWAVWVAALVLSTCLGTVLIGSCAWVRSRLPKHDPATSGG